MANSLEKYKSFLVVRFVAVNSVDFVPKTWIEAEGDFFFVRFPKNKTSTVKRLQWISDSVPNDVWPKWEIQVKKSYGNLLINALQIRSW